MCIVTKENDTDEERSDMDAIHQMDHGWQIKISRQIVATATNPFPNES
jgi:hypothetical protein